MLAGVYAFAAGKAWIQKPAIVYGISTATTLLPCLTDVLFGGHTGHNKLALVAIYTPYLLIPLALAIRMLCLEEPFPSKAPRRFSKKRA